MMKLKDYCAALDTKAKMMKAAKTETVTVIARWAGTNETAEWSAWTKYWNAIGAYATLSLTETRTIWTVPTLYPWEFDIDYQG